MNDPLEQTSKATFCHINANSSQINVTIKAERSEVSRETGRYHVLFQLAVLAASNPAQI